MLFAIISTNYTIVTYMKIHLPSMLAKCIETINKPTQQTSSHYKIHKTQPQRA